MASTTALWISIELAFTEVEQGCIEARAAELAIARKNDEAVLLRAMAGGRTVTQGPDVGAVDHANPRQLRAAELSRDLAFREAHPDGADFVELRAKIRKRFQWLKGQLAEALTEHEVHYVLFPLVVYADELVTSITHGQAGRYEPLQSELYEVDNGGELFYTVLEDHLRKSETHPIIFEVFFFCLSDGFVGMLEGDARRIAEYKARLAERIPFLPVTDPTAPRREPRPAELVELPWRGYAAAAAAIAFGWAVFSWVASTS